MKRAVIFDLDGTLLYTLDDLCAAVNHGLTLRGLPPIDREQTRARVGNGIRSFITQCLPAGADEQTIDDCLADFRSYYEAHLHDFTRPYPGISALIDALSQLGVQSAVLSNKYDPASKRLIAHFFGDKIALTLGERPGVPRKPDPTSTREVLETLGVSAEDVLYVGDSGVDMQTAKNAGLTAVGVTWGFRDRETLLENGADLLIERPDELLWHFLDPAALVRAFEARGFGCVYFDTAAEALDHLKAACAGKTVAFGGSCTLDAMGAYEALGETAEVYWHWKGDGIRMGTDCYLTSANALSAEGEIVNIDGNCNRVAASLYGPQTVFCVCGLNKVALDLTAAIDRARNVAAPLNAKRLNRRTPCAVDGRCHDCRSPERICRTLNIMLAPSTGVGRTEVVLIGEALGY